MPIQLIILIIVSIITVVITFFALRFSSFKNWLVYAVSEAEKELGGGTGKLKLRYVYDLAVSTFPGIVKLIPFSLFSVIVDSALNVMRDMIDTNNAIANVITRSEENNVN